MYYIYHIKGVKIGVSEEPEQRVTKQGFSDYEILEEHTDIYKVSDREQELQKQYGYKVDTAPYHISRSHWGSKAGKVGGKSRSQKKLDTFKKNRITWAESSKFRDREKVLYNAKHNGGTNKHRDCIHCGRTINLMNIGRHEVKCARDTGITP